ncbi:NAD(P)/FAD-dependent oxidoreductase [Candidatus Saccharibacteria bacterium]|nr:NAD(P)/FAD-dependent oxidoreductase [Candidatus Saccharibacteria bacterium]
MAKRKKGYDYDLIVIGSGSGGSVGANIAARGGKKVAVFEKEKVLGGECPNWACVPTKALLYASHIYSTAKNGAQYGLTADHIGYDYKKVKQWKDLVVQRTGTSEGDAIFADNGIDVFHGSVRFIGSNEITSEGRRYTARKFLIASGTNNFIPPVMGLEDAGYITFKEAIDLKEPPKSLLIIGGGAIGVEFAQLFSTFGTKIHLIELAPRLLGREEPEAADLAKAIFESRGLDITTHGSIHSIKKVGGKKQISFSDGQEAHIIDVDEILVASGKTPNVDLGLENAQVAYTRRGITVNKYMQTTADHIYAAGDVAGPYQFTHTASYQSRLAANNMFSRKSNWQAADYSSIPRCIFIEPEVASVGISEQEVKDLGIKPKIGITPISIVGRSNTSNSSTGFVKIVADQRGRILGATIIAPRAGEMIHEIALAIHKKLTARDIASLVHAFPTWSEAIRIAATQIH